MELTYTIFKADLHLTDIQINWLTFYQPSNKGNTELRQLSLKLSFFLRHQQEGFFCSNQLFEISLPLDSQEKGNLVPRVFSTFNMATFREEPPCWKPRRTPGGYRKGLRNIPFWNASPDKPLHYLWVNTSCHPEYGDIFGIYPDDLPVLLFAKPKQRLFTILRGELTTDKVGEVVEQIFQGEEELSPFSRLNDMLPINCHETTAQSTKPSKKDQKVKK